MFRVLESKPAHGEMVLFYEWKEDHAGTNDEVVKKVKLEAEPDGNVSLKEFYKYTSLAPRPRGSHNEEHIYSISVTDLIKLIKENGIKKR